MSYERNTSQKHDLLIVSFFFCSLLSSLSAPTPLHSFFLLSKPMQQNWQDTGYNHMIVWLDKNVCLPNDCLEMKKAFATTTNPESDLQTTLNDIDINNYICDEETKRKTSFINVPFPYKLFTNIISMSYVSSRECW